MGTRRVVTGHTSDGKATVASDTIVEPYLGLSIIWGADETPTFPDDGSPLPYTTYFPPLGGFRFAITTFFPQSVIQQTSDQEAVFGKIEDKFPGILDHMEKDNPGMHTTDTIDLGYIVSGEIWIELDNGEEVHLRAGDTFIQNGTRHAMLNKGAEPCQAVCCMIGAHRK
ncbi:MAG: cupin domain-containing protein [Dehalococcoidia bacterium]|nr:MAG: cupin domain-containing protein [Dehalococcoidia bacterium]